MIPADILVEESIPQELVDSISEPNITFPLFYRLPAEIRVKIWEAAITPRIIKCKHSHDRNLFTGPSHPVALFNTCQESREAAFLYGEYDLISTSPSMVYFSLKYDYLWFDAGWTSLVPQFPMPPNSPPTLRHDFTESLPSHLLRLRNIMIHPNWSDQRMKPTVQFAKFPQLKHVLVAADERSIGIQSQVMLDTIYDLKMYYTLAKRSMPKAKTPHIAVGCLGWTGPDGKRLYHTNEDNRQLVGVFESYGAMKDHQQSLRDMEWKFTRDRFSIPKPSIIAKLQRAKELSERKNLIRTRPADSSSPIYDNLDSQTDVSLSELPTYRDVVSTDVEARENTLDFM
jgi:hypothetical protein